MEPKKQPLVEKPEDAESNNAAIPTNDEQGGRGGLEPTRYGDWEIGGKCVDF